MEPTVTVVPGWLGVLGGRGDVGQCHCAPGVLLCKRFTVTNEQGRVIVPPFIVGGEGQFFCRTEGFSPCEVHAGWQDGDLIPKI